MQAESAVARPPSNVHDGGCCIVARAHSVWGSSLSKLCVPCVFSHSYSRSLTHCRLRPCDQTNKRQAAVKAVFPNAEVTNEGSSGYPITVTITRVDDGEVVWTGSQKKLFRKYKKNRNESIKQIKAACTRLLNSSASGEAKQDA